jgi:hypothetical protein
MATDAAASARIVHLSRLAGAQVGEMIQFIPISPFPCSTFRYIIHGPSLPWRRRLPPDRSQKIFRRPSGPMIEFVPIDYRRPYFCGFSLFFCLFH